MKKIAIIVLAAAAVAVAHATELHSNLYLKQLPAKFSASGRYYGTQSEVLPSTAFTNCLALTEEAARPLIVLYANSSTAFDSFIYDLNSESMNNLGWGNGKEALFTLWFGTSSAADRSALGFVKQHYGNVGSEIALVCYGKCEDGFEYVTSNAVSSVGQYKSKVNTYITAYNALAKVHVYTPPAASAGFAVKDGELKVVSSAEQVYVPFIRTNNLDVAETNWMVSEYPDGAVETNEFSWAANGELYKDVPLALGGRLTNVNDKVILALLNTNQVAVATNHIVCVAAPANTATFPYLRDAVETLPPGEWSVDAGLIDDSSKDVENLRKDEADAITAYDAAMNALAVAVATSNTTYVAYAEKQDALEVAIEAYDVATNALAIALATSNTTYVTYTEKQTALESAIAAYDAATNALATAVATSNTTYVTYTEKQTALESAIGAYDAATNALAAAVATSNTTYEAYAEKQSAFELATGEYDAATNALAAAVATSNTTYAAYAEKLAALELATGEYDAATNALAQAIATSNTTYVVYTEKQAALELAIGEYDAATNALAIALDEYGVDSQEYKDAQSEVVSASIKKSTAEGECSTAMGAYDDAVADVETKQGVVTEKETAVGLAQSEYDTAKGAYDDAVADAGTKQGVATEKETAMGTAQSERDTAKGAYDDAVADVGTKQGLATEKETAMGTAQSERDTAKGAYDDAVADVGTKQGVVTEKETAMGTAQSECDTAKGAYDDAVADVNAKQDDLTTKTNDLNAAIAALESAESKYFIVVNGGIVWDDGLIALNDAVFTSSGFTAWCTSNQVSLVYLDKAESGTGASLFSYNVASNGNSGTSFMSINGLTAEEGSALAAQAEEDAENLGVAATLGQAALPSGATIAMVRADGTVCGRLRPQFNSDGTCDFDENMARLDELLAQAADVAEAANDTPNGAPAESAMQYGGGEVAGTLSVNDMVDCFKLVGDGWYGKKIVFALAASALGSKPIPSEADPDVVVMRYDADSGFLEVVDYELSIFATNGVRDVELAYSFHKEDIDAGRIFVVATAYADADSVKFVGDSAFSYAISAYEATPNAGIITFDAQPETAVIQESTNQVFNVPLYRMFGSDGEVSVNVVVDESLTTATGRFEFIDANLVWTNGETGVKYVPITLKGSEYNDGLYDITLRIEDPEEAMAGVEKYYTTYTISYGKEPSEAGQLAIVSVTPAVSADGRIYVRYGSLDDGTLRTEDEMAVQINRTGGKGPAAAYISWKNGKESFRETLSWANYLTGTQTAFLADGFPAPGKSGYADVTITATSSNDVPMVKTGATLKVRVLPYDAPAFEADAATWSGVQYTTTETNVVALAVPDGMTVKSLKLVSGSVPAGLKVAFVDGQLVVKGTPTAGTVSTTATYWVQLVRAEGGTVYSMPVTVTFENKALADVNDSFASAKTWMGLPMTNETRRLKGLLDLTVAKNGKTSVRYRMAAGKTIAFSAPGLAGIDLDGTARLAAEKNYCCGSKYVFSATLGANGSLDATVTLDDGCAGATVVGAVSLDSDAMAWSAVNTAERYGGDYVAAFPLGATTNENTLCYGSPTMRLKFGTQSAWNRGAVTFAGTLPNGKAISGTAYLVPTTEDAVAASLPVFTSSSSDTFSAMLELDGGSPTAAPGVVPFWSHNEAGIDSLSYENDYDVVGALWSWAGWNWIGEKVNVNRTSGIAGGTMRIDLHGGTGPLTTVTWRGVALPGDKPRILGAYWSNALMPSGDSRRRTVRVGYAVELSDAE